MRRAFLQKAAQLEDELGRAQRLALERFRIREREIYEKASRRLETSG